MKKIYPYAYIHLICKEYAFFIDHIPNDGEKALAGHILTENGPVSAGDRIICQRCGGPIEFLHTDRIKKLKHPIVVDPEKELL